MNKSKVLAISGSTRHTSYNISLIRAIADLSAEFLEITLYNSIANLPQYNPDEDVENISGEVHVFRQLLQESEGVIICTPEYAHGVPGALKNALDWTVSSSLFPGKPTMLITAATDGNYGHRALMETLKALEAKNIVQLQMVISFAKTKISTENKITDVSTLKSINALIDCFVKTINEAD